MEIANRMCEKFSETRWRQ